jgi:ribosomal protein S18 acetylase RimI-like enzyme
MKEMVVFIREAQENDIPELVTLLRELFELEMDFQFDQVKQRRGLALLIAQPEKGLLLVAQVGVKLVGMCSCQYLISTAEGSPVGLLEDMVIKREFRGRGVGRLLLNEIETRAQNNGLKRLQLLADKENDPALEFYSRMGWQVTNLVALRKT